MCTGDVREKRLIFPLESPVPSAPTFLGIHKARLNKANFLLSFGLSCQIVLHALTSKLELRLTATACFRIREKVLLKASVLLKTACLPGERAHSCQAATLLAEK